MKILILAISLSLITFFSHAQIITTIAGNGPGNSGNGNLATLCELYYPVDITNDNLGNTYISDNGNHQIRKIDKFGVITLFASIGLPSAIICDKNNNIYVASQGEMSVVKFSPTGIRTTIAGKCDGVGAYSGDGGLATLAGLNYPHGVAIDSLNNVYIATTGDGRIRKVDTMGIINTICGNGTNSHTGDGGPANIATLGVPRGICLDKLGNLYIAEQGSCCIRKINTLGIISTVGGLGNGSSNYTGDGGLATFAELCPLDVIVDSIGNIYLSDAGNQVIRKIDLNGIITTVAGNGSKLGPGGSAGNGSFSGDGGLPTLASLNAPWGLFIDKQGSLLIADWFNHRIRKVNKSTVSVGELYVATKFSIYPNPTNGIFNISGLASNTQIVIYDAIGQIVFSSDSDGTNESINLVALADGIYLVKVKFYEKEFNAKIIKN
jgi:hypothetical protein